MGIASKAGQPLTLVAVAFREAAGAERLAREIRAKARDAEVIALVSDRALREAAASAKARRVDILVADDPSASAFVALCPTESLPVIGVLGAGPASDAFTRIGEGAGPERYSPAALWVAGAVSGIARGLPCSGVVAEYSRRYEELVQALPDIVYELDVDGVITFVNDSVSIIGYSPAELVGKHYSVLLHDDDAAAVDRDRVLPDFAGYRTGLALSPKLFNERRGIDRRTTDLEVRLKRRPGSAGQAQDVIGSVISYGEVSSAGEYSRDGEGEFKGSVGIIRDVTLRRKSEEMLRKLYQAVDQLGACVFVLNHAFEVEYVNPAFFMLTGFAPPDVIGRSVFRFFAFSPDKAERMGSRIHDGFETREEVLVPRAVGGQFWAAFSLAPVRTPSGAITHAIAIVEDVSARKAMEESIRSARRDAEEASRAKSKFLSSVTHELKNPIVGILSAARLLELERADTRSATIIENAEVLLEVLNGILDYVRSENVEGAVQRLSFPLGPFLERTCSRYRVIAESKGLAFSLLAPEGETVESDPDRLQRALEILVDNAVRYTDSGAVEVAASVERRDGNVPHLRVRVADTGSGISPDERDAVFRPFSSSDAARRTTGRSGGAGLALAKNIVMVLGGEIRLESDRGKGSVFTVVMPASAPVSPVSVADRRYSLLIVDDNEVYLEYMHTLVENRGYRVHRAGGAAAAFRVLETRYVDAAILDIQMPGYSGIELAKAIRAYAGAKYSPSMPLFAMTAQDDTALEAEPSFNRVFQKPTDISALSAALDEAMAARERESSMALASAGIGRAGAMSRVRLEAEASISALSVALSGTSDARVDIRAEAAALESVFQRFACKSGLELARLFIEHYPDEDKTVLSGLLARMSRIVDAGLRSIEATSGN